VTDNDGAFDVPPQDETDKAPTSEVTEVREAGQRVIDRWRSVLDKLAET
jgi:hypothetical protein